MTDLAFTDAADLVALYGRRDASPLEPVEACLERIDAVNRVLNAYVTVDREGARGGRAPAARDPGPGPLHGVPVGIKDLTETAGMRTTYGSTIHADHVPDVDALVVERLRAAGAIIVGKTNTPEFGAGGNTFNDVFGADAQPLEPGAHLRRLERRLGGRARDGHEPAVRGLRPRRIAAHAGAASAASSASARRRAWCRRGPSATPFDGLAVTGPIGRTVADSR